VSTWLANTIIYYVCVLDDEILNAAPGYLSVAEAGARLGVTDGRVRALIRSGELAAARFGTTWMVRADAVDQRSSLGDLGSRRFTPSNAWGLLYLAAGGQAPWLTPQDRWRLRRYLDRSALAELRSPLAERGRPTSYRGHPGILDRLREDGALMLTGVTAAHELRLGLVGGAPRVDAYVDGDAVDRLVAQYRLSRGGEPNVTLRRVPPFGLAWPPSRVAPRSAVGLDLLDDPDPRARQVGKELLASR
jgi:excisionase family DNA binding protein